MGANIVVPDAASSVPRSMAWPESRAPLASWRGAVFSGTLRSEYVNQIVFSWRGNFNFWCSIGTAR
jgi:hypothetical protein